jgi:type II secretory pathway component PulF
VFSKGPAHLAGYETMNMAHISELTGSIEQNLKSLLGHYYELISEKKMKRLLQSIDPLLNIVALL